MQVCELARVSIIIIYCVQYFKRRRYYCNTITLVRDFGSKKWLYFFYFTHGNITRLCIIIIRLNDFSRSRAHKINSQVDIYYIIIQYGVRAWYTCRRVVYIYINIKYKYIYIRTLRENCVVKCVQNVCTCRYITIDVDPAQAADYIIILFIIYYNKHAQITGRTSIWVRSDAISSIDELKRGIKVWKGRVIIIDGVDGWNWKHKLTLKNLKTYRKNNMLSARAVELNWIPRRKTRTSRAD